MIKEGIQNILASRSKTLMVFCSCVLISCALWSLRSETCPGPETICFYNDRRVVVEGVVVAEPKQGIGKNEYVVAATYVAAWGATKGNVLLTTKAYPVYHYGDILSFDCRLKRPTSTPGSTFNYEKYAAKEGVGVTCGFPRYVELRGHKSSWLDGVFWFKQRLQEKIQALWTEPESSLMAGVLYGSKSTLPQAVQENFSRTGVSHIIAVSGFNTSLIAAIVLALLIRVGVRRKTACSVALIALAVFVIFTGASASVVRAGVMGSIMIIGTMVGRPSSIGRALLLTATVMTIANPYIVLWDVGFQLSFLATLGLVYVSPFIKKYLGRVGAIPLLGEVISATLAAEVATLPIILYYFGQLPLTALLVNALILPLIPWIMLGGFISICLGTVYWPLGQLFAWLPHLGMSYMLGVTEWFATRAWSVLPLALPWWFVVVCYIVEVGFCVYGQNKNKSL